MKTRFLFPLGARYIGIILLVAGLLFNFYSRGQGNREIFVWQHFHAAGQSTLRGDGSECFDDEIQLSLVLIGLIFIASSKEKIEDEHISSLRLESLQWAMYVNYAVFFILIYTCYGLSFLAYSFYNVLTLLVFFIVRFRWKIYSLNRSLKADAA